MKILRLVGIPLVGVALGSYALAASVNTSSLSQNGWYSDDTRADGFGTQVAGTNLKSPTLTDFPEAGSGNVLHNADIQSQISFLIAPGTVPLGTFPSAVRLRIGNSGSGKSTISHRKDDGIGHAPGSVVAPGFSINYSWMGNGPSSITAALKIGIKTADYGSTPISARTGENAWDKLLIYEPGNLNGTTSDGNWHVESSTFTSGTWWLVDRTIGANTIGNPMTLSAMSTSGAVVSGAKTLAMEYALITAPGAHITSIQFGIGSGNANGNVYVNQLVTSFYRVGSTTTFGPPPEFTATNLAVGTTPCDVIAEELSGDAKADIATADSGSNSVTVRFNSGTGTFPTSTTIGLTSGDAPSALAAGDLVVGGGRDLAVAATGNDVVRIVRNNPAGTFAVTASLSTLPATEPVGIDVGNLDGTGTDDIAVAMQGDLLIAGTGSVMVSLNGGALVALTPPAGGFKRPQRVAISDLDGDGDGDLIVTMSGSAFSPTLTTNVLLYENLGAGAFAAPITLSVSQNPKGICSGDFDGDGDNDLAVTAESFPTILPGNVVVFKNTGLTAGSWNSSAFAAGGTFTGGSSPIDLECADLRDDSLPGFISAQDIVAVNFGSENLTRYDGYNGGSSSFAAQATVLAHQVPAAVAIAHFDDDKTLDLVVANKASNDVTVLLSITPSLAQTFGSGCPGTTGIPVISAIGLPSFGNPAFGVKVSNARVFAPTLLGLSLNQFTTPLGSCNLYLLPPIVLLNTVTNGLGEATVTLPIPGPFSGFAGSSAFFQYFIFDPNGAYTGQFAFSNALRIKVGN